MAIVVLASIFQISKPGEVGVWMDEMRVGLGEGEGACPEGGKGTRVVEDGHVEAVFEFVVAHEAKYIVVDVTEVVDLFLISFSVAFPPIVPSASPLFSSFLQRENSHQAQPANTNHNPSIWVVCKRTQSSTDTYGDN